MLWVIIRGLSIARKAREPLLVAFSNGCIGILLLNATNPVMGTYDFMWGLFLPVAAINVFSVQADS